MTNLIPDSFVIQSSSHFETHCWIRVTAPRPERCRAANLMVTLLQLVRIWIDRLREKKCTRLYEVSCFVRAGSAARRDSKWYGVYTVLYIGVRTYVLQYSTYYLLYSTVYTVHTLYSGTYYYILLVICILPLLRSFVEAVIRVSCS